VLTRLDRADEAVACLRHARAIFPRDEGLADELVAALLGVGAAREAAEVLEERVAALAKDAGAPGDMAALLVRLGAVYTDLDDRDSARRCLEKALQHVPDHPSALAALSRLARGLDPRAYADARLREAAGAKDVAAKVAAYLSAGATLQGRLGDTEGARRAFQAVLELEPANAEAIWALSALAPSQAEAQALLERRLAEELPGEERARVLTELAALAQSAGVHAMAAKRLEEALAAQPDHVPAVVARADLLRAEGAFAELEAFLRGVLPRLDGAPAAVRAELHRRAAEACERLGRDDDAYVLLNEADRLHRGELRTKLALGENRFRARRWREAALHLSALADHPDAISRAGEVAAGLAHAAVAETRALRPDRAPALYEAALRFDPDHTPALHALAEIAMERGDVAGAADLLERQADATADPPERVRLYEALGDLAERALADPARARACYEQAVASASPLEAKHVPLLHKLRVAQRDAADAAGAGRTCELLSSFSADARTRGAYLLETAELYAMAGDATRARAAAARAVDADPANETALHLATELDLALADPEAAASRLGRALPGLPAPDDADTPRRAELWRRLGEARRTRGDAKGAIPAYEKAVATAPDSEAADAARERLVSLLGADHAIAHLRALASRLARPADIHALGQALMATSIDGAHVALTLARALGETLPPADAAFLDAHPSRRMAPDETYAAALDDADAALLGDGADGALHDVCAALGEAAALLWPDPAKAIGEGARRLAAGRAAAIYHQVAKVVAPPTVLFVAEAAGAPDVAVVCASPPAVVLGPRLVGDELGDVELRFILARAAFATRAARLPGAGLARARLAVLAQALATFGGTPAATPEVDAEAQHLRRTLPLRVRLRVEVLARAPLDAERYRAACERAADRAGLLLAGDVAAAAQATHLARFAASEAFLALRAKIGLKVV
jgi:tetratricopeptide (TPR) repeat protein